MLARASQRLCLLSSLSVTFERMAAHADDTTTAIQHPTKLETIMDFWRYGDLPVPKGSRELR